MTAATESGDTQVILRSNLPATVPAIVRVGDLSPPLLMQRLLALVQQLKPKALATSVRKPKPKAPQGYVDGAVARAHIATARVLKSGRVPP